MTLLLITCLQELFFRPVSSDALLQTHFFRRILPDASKLQIKFLCSWTCSIRIFMNRTLIMDPVHLNKLFSKSNWWFLIPCYYQNSIGDFVKHPLFQQEQPACIKESFEACWSPMIFCLIWVLSYEDSISNSFLVWGNISAGRAVILVLLQSTTKVVEKVVVHFVQFSFFNALERKKHTELSIFILRPLLHFYTSLATLRHD